VDDREQSYEGRKIYSEFLPIPMQFFVEYFWFPNCFTVDYPSFKHFTQSRNHFRVLINYQTEEKMLLAMIIIASLSSKLKCGITFRLALSTSKASY
jgi:hypothetical protein